VAKIWGNDEESNMKLVEVTNYQKSLDGMSEQDQILAVKTHMDHLRNIKNPSEAVQLAAVSSNGHSIYHIMDKGIVPSEAVQLAAVSSVGEVVGDLTDPSEAVQLAAVNQDAWAIQYIDNPSPEVQQTAVDNAGWEVLQYVHNRSPIVVKNVLMNYELITDEILYRFVVTTLLKDNTLLMKKWLRYGETMRNQK
jgi:hypothetical protein